VRESGDPVLADILSSTRIVSSPRMFWMAVAQDPHLVCVHLATQVSAGFESNHYSIAYLNDDVAKKTFDDTSGAFTAAFGVSRSREWTIADDEGKKKKLITPSFYTGFSIRRGDKLDAPDGGSFCVPLGTGALECFEGPRGAPVIGDQITTLVAEARIWTGSQTAGFNPRYTWAQTPDGHSDTFEVPIFLMRQEKDINAPEFKFGADLIGGVSPGWRRGAASSNGWFVSVFLTKAFGLP
jgi:hypothetical protein